LTDFVPAFGELAASERQDLIARAVKVGHAGFHGPRSGAGQDEDLVFRLEDILKPLLHMPEEIGKLLPSMMNHGLCHSPDDFLGEARGTRCEESLLQNHLLHKMGEFKTPGKVVAQEPSVTSCLFQDDA